jgi:16S rRNA (uracil1498-N3)-methyltransferase
VTTAAVFWASPDQLAAEQVVLDGPEGHHAANVRRVRAGEVIDVVDGSGGRVTGEVVAVERGRVIVDVVERTSEPPAQPRVVVVQALAKGDRGERAVETMTEVGVDAVVPWAASRSVVQWRSDRGERALERWRSVAREAAKQARRAWFPEVAELHSTSAVAQVLAGSSAAFVLHEGASRELAGADLPGTGDVVLVVGPEGGLTVEELAVFNAAGAAAMRLGPTVLRTSTAGVVAAGVVLARTRWT